MRKIMILAILIVGAIVVFQSGFLLSTMDFEGRYTLYGAEFPTEEYTLSPLQATKESLLNGKAEGKSYRFYGGDEEESKLLSRLRVEVVSTQELGGLKVIYGYSARLGQGVTLYGREVNFQLARRGSTITVGTPLIKGSY